MSNADSEVKIPLDRIIKNARKILRDGSAGAFNAFEISAIVGAVTNVPKEYIIEEMLKSD